MGNRKYRPVNRLLGKSEGYGKAQVLTKNQLGHVLWLASRGHLGAAIRASSGCSWLLVGPNEVGKLKIKDVIFPNGELWQAFIMPGGYTKTRKSRVVYLLIKHQRQAIYAWREQRLAEGA